MNSDIDFLLNEIRQECEIGNIKLVIILSEKLKHLTQKQSGKNIFQGKLDKVMEQQKQAKEQTVTKF